MAIAFMFPGQGAQRVKMGKDYYDEFPVFKNAFDRYSEVLKIDLKKLCFEENDSLNRTQFTQVAMLSVSLSTLKLLEKYDIKADVNLGYSLGEYGALVSSGVLTDDEALLLVKERGRIMEEACPKGFGAMAAVIGLKDSEVEEVVDKIDNVWIANYNYDGQVTITGLKEGVDEASAKLKERRARVIQIPVSGPFHSPLLKAASEEFGKILDTVKVSTLKTPYMPNVSGIYETDSTNTKLLLEKQIYSPVMWSRSLEILKVEKYDTLIEVGTGHTLVGFCKKSHFDAKLFSTDTVDEFKELILSLKGDEK